jgi:hypothetical protein
MSIHNYQLLSTLLPPEWLTIKFNTNRHSALIQRKKLLYCCFPLPWLVIERNRLNIQIRLKCLVVKIVNSQYNYLRHIPRLECNWYLKSHIVRSSSYRLRWENLLFCNKYFFLHPKYFSSLMKWVDMLFMLWLYYTLPILTLQK